eukprot:3437473-Prymnesium_polylepis.1
MDSAHVEAAAQGGTHGPRYRPGKPWSVLVLGDDIALQHSVAASLRARGARGARGGVALRRVVVPGRQ